MDNKCKAFWRVWFALFVLVVFPRILAAQTPEFPPHAEIPICPGNDTAVDHEIHTYEGFTFCYRDSYELSEWVAYELTREELAAVVGRSNNFAADPSISTGSALPDDYYRSGFDRGHLAPAADMRFSQNAMNESFYMSNMSPQTPSLNRGVWKYLEEAVRLAVWKYDRVLVVSGPVLDRYDFPVIGYSTAVSVPEYYYKVLTALITDTEGNRGLHMIGFIIPNGKPQGVYIDYALTVDEVEARTGLDFFSAFPDDIEDAAECSFNIEYW
ncbi:MAG: DNA/RNA non-specific endonuclease [Treponema sp.]|jgi:endonuclease G|nr:DNA/RNA non-specific endonuclease [Treponema sp.]